MNSFDNLYGKFILEFVTQKGSAYFSDMFLRVILCFLICICFNNCAFAQASQFSTFGSNQSDFGTHLMETPDQGFAETISLALNSPTNSQIGVGMMKLDCAGKIQWQKRFGFETESLISKKFILRGDEYTLLSSRANGLNSQKTHILELDAAGNIQSEHSFLSSQTELPKDIISRPNGNYLVLAAGNYNVDFETIHLFLVNGFFSVLQSLQFSLPNREIEPEAMLVLADGGVLICGDASTQSTFREGFVLRLNAGGVPVWAKSFASDFDVEFSDMVLDDQGRINVSGYVYQLNNGFDGLALQLNQDGEVLSQKAFHSTIDDKFRAIEYANNEFIFAGDAGGFDGRSMAWLNCTENLTLKSARKLDYGDPFTNYIYSVSPMQSGAWLMTGEFATPGGSRNGGMIRTDSLIIDNCQASEIQFSVSDLNLTVGNLNLIRAELDRVVEVTDLLEYSSPVFNESVVCSTVPPTAKASYSATPECPRVCVEFTDSSYCSVTYRVWNFPGGEPETTTSETPLVCYPGDGFYQATLIVGNEGGLDTLLIDVNLSTGCNLPVPNAFSPNGDGFNDLFVIPGFPPGAKLRIFNRWGNVVLESDDYDNSWDGNNVTAGTYFYAIESLEGQMYSGYILIVK